MFGLGERNETAQYGSRLSMAGGWSMYAICLKVSEGVF